jgi:hypothetical protein
MKKLGWFPFLVACWLSFLAPTPAHACTAPCTKAQIATDIATNWPDNTSGGITPALLRATVLELVNSYIDANGGSSFTCPSNQFLLAIATLSTYSCAQVTLANIAAGAGTDNVVGYWSSTVLSAQAVPNCATALVYSTSTHLWGCNVGGGTGSVTAGGGGIVPTSGGPATLFVEQMNPGGRITLASGVPVMTADQAGAVTIWYAPYVGKYVPIYDGTNMELHQFTASDSDITGLSISLGSNWAANTLYDFFITLNGGVVTFCSGPGWTTSTAGAGLRSQSLATFKGLQVNAGSMTCRLNNTTTITTPIDQGTYVGTCITNASTGQIDFKFGSAASGGGPAVAGCWNMYNQVPGAFVVQDSKATWTCASGGFGPTDASTSNRISAVNGFANSAIDALYQERTDATTGNFVLLGIGVNSTTGPGSKGSSGLIVGVVASTTAPLKAIPPAIGFNFYQALEDASTTLTCEGGGTSEVLQATWWW